MFPIPLVLFLHIPKAAGTTLHRILEHQYRPTQILSVRASKHNVYRLPAKMRNRLHLVKGHFAYGLHEAFAQPSTYFSVMRHPVEQVTSYYYYVRNRPSDQLGQYIRDNQLGLEQFINTRRSLILHNMQVRYLAGLPTTGTEHRECTADDLQRARSHIASHFALVGLVERFDETLLLLKRQFGWHDVFYAVQNVNRRRDSSTALPQATYDVIVEANALDLALYEEVQQQFETRLSEAGPAFAQEVDEFRLRNAQQQRRLQIRMAYTRLVGCQAENEQFIPALDRASST